MAPDFGAGAAVLFFFALLIAQILLSLCVFSYAAYSFFTAFVNTAAGSDVIHWPKDPYQDWFFKVWYLAWLLGVWAAPASLLLGLFELPRPPFWVGLVGLLWLVFPVTLLSALSASSSVVLFRGLILQLLLKHPGTAVRFYLSTGPLLAICGGLCYVGVLTDYAVVLLVAGPATAVGFLIYARLLGRLAWVTSLRKPGKRKAADPPKPEESDRLVTFDPWKVPGEKTRPEPEPPPPTRPKKLAKKKAPTRKRERAHDPWAVPPEETPRQPAKPPAAPALDPDDPYGPAQGSYDVMSDDAPRLAPAPPPPPDPLDPDLQPYALSPAAETAPTAAPPPAPPVVSKLEEELAAPRKPPKLPPQPLLNGVYNFPFYPTSLAPLCTLAVGFLAVAALLRLQIEAFPAAWK